MLPLPHRWTSPRADNLKLPAPCSLPPRDSGEDDASATEVRLRRPSHAQFRINPHTEVQLKFIPALMFATSLVALTAPALAQKVLLSTSMGDIVVELEPAKAPKTVENFLQYVRSGHYDGTMFHRVINDFMIQGGGYKADMAEKPVRAPITLESRSGLSNVRGTLAMARTNVPDSATAQFFINVKDNVFLDQPNARDGNGYAVFGRVVVGMDVVDKIKAVPTRSLGEYQNVPVTAVVLKSAKVEK
jgi:peptidyl-prolyl cis-trans isomerase A (cyclophilin A)